MHKKVLFNRIAWIEKNLEGIRSLPLESYDVFMKDKRNIRVAEFYLRKGLEAVLDLGRYILINGFGIQVSKYEEIAEKLDENGVLSKKDVILLKIIAHKCYQLVYYRSEITEKDIYKMCKEELEKLSRLKDAYSYWIKANFEKIAATLH